MKTIQPFHIAPGTPQSFQLPQGTELLSVKPEGGMIVLYALVDQNPAPPIEYKIDTFITGQPVPYDIAVQRVFLGSCVLVDGRTFHVFHRL